MSAKRGGGNGGGAEAAAAQHFPEIKRGSGSREAGPVLECPRAESRLGEMRFSARRQP